MPFSSVLEDSKTSRNESVIARKQKLPKLKKKKKFHANGKQKKAGVAILISDKMDFKIKNITRDEEGHYLVNKGSIQEEDTTIVNIYEPNIGAPQYIRGTLTDIKGEIDSNTMIVGDFNIPLTKGKIIKIEN